MGLCLLIERFLVLGAGRRWGNRRRFERVGLERVWIGVAVDVRRAFLRHELRERFGVQRHLVFRLQRSD